MCYVYVTGEIRCIWCSDIVVNFKQIVVCETANVLIQRYEHIGRFTHYYLFEIDDYITTSDTPDLTCVLHIGHAWIRGWVVLRNRVYLLNIPSISGSDETICRNIFKLIYTLCNYTT